MRGVYEKILKNILCLLLISAFLCPSPPAAADLGLRVTEEYYYIAEEEGKLRAYAFARVENIGRDMLTVKSGLFEVLADDGSVLAFDDTPAFYAAAYLKPGEYGYVKGCAELDERAAEKAAGFRFSAEPELYKERAYTERFPCAGVYEEDVIYGRWLSYDYMQVTFTNPKDEVLYDLEAVMILRAADGTILNIGYAFMGLFNDAGLHPGSTVTLRDINSAGLQAACEEKGYAPAQVEALAYREVYAF